MMTLEEAVKKVRPLNEKAIESAKKDGTALQSRCILWGNLKIC